MTAIPHWSQIHALSAPRAEHQLMCFLSAREANRGTFLKRLTCGEVTILTVRICEIPPQDLEIPTSLHQWDDYQPQGWGRTQSRGRLFGRRTPLPFISFSFFIFILFFYFYSLWYEQWVQVGEGMTLFFCFLRCSCCCWCMISDVCFSV